jgi:protein-tyrosine phosphatase
MEAVGEVEAQRSSDHQRDDHIPRVHGAARYWPIRAAGTGDNKMFTTAPRVGHGFAGGSAPSSIAMALVDLHLHLLPGVDDGPPDTAASLVHAARIARDGVREATVTPHVGHPDYPLDPATIPARTRALQDALDAAGIELRLHPGGEIFPGGATALGRDHLDVIAHGPPGARWVLLEVPFDGIGAEFLRAADHVRRHGFGLLIAHPERAAGLLPDGLRRLGPAIAAGALLQVNVSSLLGRHGPEAWDAAERLVRDGHAYVLASDGHGGTRSDTLAAGARVRGGHRLTEANPRFLLEHGIPPGPGRDGLAWRSPHERRVQAAIAAARRGVR